MFAMGCGASSPAEPTPAPTATAPAPTAPPAAASVRWVGTTPDGMHVEREARDECPAEFDLELNLTTTGSTVTGSATTLLRRVEAQGDCSNVFRAVHSYTLFNGRLSGDSISFDFGNASAYKFAGTIAGARMTGTFEITQFPQSGRFAVTRQ